MVAVTEATASFDRAVAAVNNEVIVAISAVSGALSSLKRCVLRGYRKNLKFLVFVLVLPQGVMKLLVFGCYDNSVREMDWRCRNRGTQAT